MKYYLLKSSEQLLSEGYFPDEDGDIWKHEKDRTYYENTGSVMGEIYYISRYTPDYLYKVYSQDFTTESWKLLREVSPETDPELFI